tara:strand:- start:1794 stop:4430 length:2637 start_codon:yes stop_codon:yes gene_type:complete
MLTKFGIEAGINREGTSYSAEGYWYDSDKVRFRKGKPEKIGGWQALSANSYLGITRSMHNWSSFNNDDYMAIGTNRKAYVEIGGTYYDITPSRFSFETDLSVAMNDAGTTGVTVNVADDGITNGSVIRIDNEFMLVTAIGTGTVTVTRGYLGSDAAAHALEAGIFEVLKSENPIGIVNGTSTVLVKDESHNAQSGDYVNFLYMETDPNSGIVRSDLLTAYNTATSTQGFEITNLLNADYYEIVVGDTGSVGTPSTLDGTLLISSGTVVVASGHGTNFDNNDIVKVGGEYIQLGTRSTDTFTGCLRGQFGSLKGQHASGTAVNELKTTATGSGTSTFDGGNCYILYDIHSGTGGYSSSSGFGAGAFAGRPDLFVSAQLTSTYTAGVATILLPAAQFGSTGTVLIGNDLSSYSSNTGSTLAGVSHISGPGIDHFAGETAYDVTSSWFGWGESATSISDLALWSLDNFGEDLVLARQNGAPYYWDSSASTTGSVPTSIISASADTNNGLIIGKAVPMSSLGSATYTDFDGATQTTEGHGYAPTQCRKLMVFPDRQLILSFGTTDISGSYEPMLLRWSDATKPGSWYPTELNDSGGEPLSSGSYIITACKSKREMLVWTDESLYSMQHHPEFVFGFTLVANGVSIIGSNAFAEAGDSIFWMDNRNFYMYQSGSLSVLPCTVLEYVFSNLNYSEKEKIFAAPNSQFNEVTFFYPSSGSPDIDRYVTYNHAENSWSIGSLSRTAWSDSGIRQKPEAAFVSDEPNEVSMTYVHEVGYDDNGSAMTAYVESAYMDLDDGGDLMFMSKFIPDIRFPAGGELDMTFNKKNYPNESASGSSYTSISGSTTYRNVRIRARQVAIKFQSTGIGVGWHLGDMRYEVKPDGRV